MSQTPQQCGAKEKYTELLRSSDLLRSVGTPSKEAAPDGRNQRCGADALLLEIALRYRQPPKNTLKVGYGVVRDLAGLGTQPCTKNQYPNCGITRLVPKEMV